METFISCTHTSEPLNPYPTLRTQRVRAHQVSIRILQVISHFMLGQNAMWYRMCLKELYSEKNEIFGTLIQH